MSVDVAVEYAKSNRSSCRGCFTTIDKETVRIGKLLSRHILCTDHTFSLNILLHCSMMPMATIGII